MLPSIALSHILLHILIDACYIASLCSLDLVLPEDKLYCARTQIVCHLP